MLSPNSRRGYTLIELVVTILIIGILTSLSVPQYMLTVENGKADDAVATANMIGTTNKMFALDHAATYVTGDFPIAPGGGVSSVCGNNGNVCPSAGPWVACALVFCKYLADQNWGDKPYKFTACDPGAAGACSTMTALAVRKGGSGPYATWGYNVAQTGVITATGGAPPPTY